MVSDTIDTLAFALEEQVIFPCETRKIQYSVGVMAYNEEANIQRVLQALLTQHHEWALQTEIIVVASGCTDSTVIIVQDMMRSESRIHLIVQERREGKASAINLFLQQALSPVLVMVGADIIPEQDALEKLCLHFTDPQVGMVGARPVPVNDQYAFVGHAVHLLWRLHDRMARRSPKLGEVVAFRNVIARLPIDTAVDEISIEASIVKHGLRLVYEPAAVVYNKGPMTVRDFLKQRRRIHAGHLQVRSQERYEASTMKVGPIVQELFNAAPYIMCMPRQVLWTLGTIALEGLARLQGYYDVLRKRPHHVWQAVASTKALEDEDRKLRRICNTQSVIVFHVTPAKRGIFLDERDKRATAQTLRKLLPLLRRYLRREDALSISGSHTLIAVLNADRSSAEMIATRLKDILATQSFQPEKRGYIRLLVNYHAVSFGV